MTKITLIKEDITRLQCDAIVNAANSTLLGGGGVDGAIHRAAGPRLLEECRKIGGCPTGEARITKGYNLPAKYVIHAVGPVYRKEESNNAALLYSCYRNSLLLAEEYKIKSIAFPAISTGVYGYPFQEACLIALQAADDFIAQSNALCEIIMVSFSEEDFQNYKTSFQKRIP